MEYKEDCMSCVFLNANGTCGNTRSIMYGIANNAGEPQLCKDRRYYTREAYNKPKKKRKIESIYDCQPPTS